MATRNWWIRGLVFGLAAVLAALIWVNRDQFVPVQQGSRVPAYVVQTLAGQKVTLPDHFAGDVVLLNVWATWCPPCVREMPALQSVHEQLGPEGLRIIGLSVDSPPGLINTWGRPGGSIENFVKEYGLTFEILWDPSGEVESAYTLSGLPTTFIIDREGRITQRVVGWRAWDDPTTVAELRRLLED